MRPRASFHSKAALLFWNGKENAMNYIPKRVFLLECGKYIELSYEEFCEKKEETEGFDAKNRRYILIQGMLLEVGEPAYREHYRICRQPAPAADFAEAAQKAGTRMNAEK